VLIFGLLALLVALPAGMLMAFLTTRQLLMLFNIDYNVFRFSTRAIVWQSLAAIVAPLLAALWPVMRGAAISVREALASYGLGGDFGSSRLDRSIERLAERVMPSPYTLHHRPGQHVPPQGALAADATRPHPGRDDVPDGADPLVRRR